jgi:tricorn protease
MRLFSLAFALLSVSAIAAPSNQGYYMQPAIGGNSIVFVSQGGLWKVPIGGGLAHAMTSPTSPAAAPAISPDDRWVAFTGSYAGTSDVYVMSMSGELPRRLTYTGSMRCVGWTPDGKVLATTSIDATLPNLQLVEIDPRTRAQKLEPLAQASEGSFEPSGKTLFFTRLPFQGSSTTRYRGGLIQQIWSYSTGDAEAKSLSVGFDGTSKDPMFWRGRIYFLSDRDGTMNLWSMDPSGGSLKQLTHYIGWDIQSASMSQGKVAFQVKADLHVFDVEAGTDTTLDVSLESDFDPSRDEWVKNPSAYMSSGHLSADGAPHVARSSWRRLRPEDS